MASSAVGQQSDFGNWFGIDVSKKINKKWTATVKGQVRTFQNAEYWRTTFLSPQITYRVSKPYKVALAYRFNWREYVNTHRIQLDNSYRKKWGKSAVQIRLRLQFTSTLGVKLEEVRVRPRLKYSYQIHKKWSAFTSVQSFYTGFLGRFEFDQMRYGVGIETKVNKGQYIQLHYMINTAYNKRYIINNYILAIKYKVNIK